MTPPPDGHQEWHFENCTACPAGSGTDRPCLVSPVVDAAEATQCVLTRATVAEDGTATAGSCAAADPDAANGCVFQVRRYHPAPHEWPRAFHCVCRCLRQATLAPLVGIYTHSGAIIAAAQSYHQCSHVVVCVDADTRRSGHGGRRRRRRRGPPCTTAPARSATATAARCGSARRGPRRASPWPPGRNR